MYDEFFKNFTQEYYPHADHLVRYLQSYKEKHNLNVRFNSRVVSVLRAKSETARERFKIILQDEEVFTCTYLIWATGFKLHTPWNTASINTDRFKTYEDFDPEDVHQYAGMDAAIFGKGNSGMETAKSLLPYLSSLDMISRNVVKKAVETHYTGDVRVMNLDAVGGYQLKSLVSLIETQSSSIDPMPGAKL